MTDKFREMLLHKIESFPNNPRGFREFEEYCQRYKIKAYYHTWKRKTATKHPSKLSAKLLVDNGEDVDYAHPGFEWDWSWVDLKLRDGWYTFVIPTGFYERCLVLGDLP